jgi:hypothetical protein
VVFFCFVYGCLPSLPANVLLFLVTTAIFNTLPEVTVNTYEQNRKVICAMEDDGRC